MTLLGAVKEVSISESMGFGGINHDFRWVVKDEQLLEELEDILKNAVYQPKKLTKKTRL